MGRSECIEEECVDEAGRFGAYIASIGWMGDVEEEGRGGRRRLQGGWKHTDGGTEVTVGRGRVVGGGWRRGA